MRNFTDSKLPAQLPDQGLEAAPWKTFARKSPPGRRVRPAKSTASSTRCIERSWSTSAMPIMLGAMSDITRSTPPGPTRACSCSRTDSSLKSPCRNSTPGIAGIVRMSIAMIRPRPSSSRAAYWLQPPGAAPRSTHGHPGAQQPVAALDFLELEHGARAPALLVRAFHIRVGRVFGQPARGTLGSFGHGSRQRVKMEKRVNADDTWRRSCGPDRGAAAMLILTATNTGPNSCP